MHAVRLIDRISSSTCPWGTCARPADQGVPDQRRVARV